MSQITTHILDTSKGKPAAGVSIEIQARQDNGWEPIGRGTTNADGRVPDLLPAGQILKPGTYRLVFGTEAYFSNLGQASFYPNINIDFKVSDSSHYHVPLLLNPFGYSTYRGS